MSDAQQNESKTHYSLADLINDVEESNAAAWNALAEFVREKTGNGRGVRIPNFGRFCIIKKTHKLVFRLDATFKRGLRTREHPLPSEAPSVDANYVVVGRNVGLNRDKARIAISRMLEHIGRLARQGHHLQVDFPGVGIIFAKRGFMGFRFNVADARDMFQQDPEASRNRPVTHSMSATAQLFQDKADMNGYEISGKPVVGLLPLPKGDNTTKNGPEDDFGTPGLEKKKEVYTADHFLSDVREAAHGTSSRATNGSNGYKERKKTKSKNGLNKNSNNIHQMSQEPYTKTPKMPITNSMSDMQLGDLLNILDTKISDHCTFFFSSSFLHFTLLFFTT